MSWDTIAMLAALVAIAVVVICVIAAIVMFALVLRDELKQGRK